MMMNMSFFLNNRNRLARLITWLVLLAIAVGLYYLVRIYFLMETIWKVSHI